MYMPILNSVHNSMNYLHCFSKRTYNPYLPIIAVEVWLLIRLPVALLWSLLVAPALFSSFLFPFRLFLPSFFTLLLLFPGRESRLPSSGRTWYEGQAEDAPRPLRTRI